MKLLLLILLFTSCVVTAKPQKRESKSRKTECALDDKSESCGEDGATTPLTRAECDSIRRRFDNGELDLQNALKMLVAAPNDENDKQRNALNPFALMTRAHILAAVGAGAYPDFHESTIANNTEAVLLRDAVALWNRAAQTFGKLSSKTPNNRDSQSYGALFRYCHVRTTWALMRLQDGSGVLQSAQLLAKMEHNNVRGEINATLEVALLFLQMKHYDPAQQLCANVLQRDPQEPLARAITGLALHQLEKYTEAIPHLLFGLEKGENAHPSLSSTSKANSKSTAKSKGKAKTKAADTTRNDNIDEFDSNTQAALGLIVNRALYSVAAGESLQRSKRDAEAREVYQRAAQRGLFLSAWQRSPQILRAHFNLTARPFWAFSDLPAKYQRIITLLQANHALIRDEIRPLLRGFASDKAKKATASKSKARESKSEFVPEHENLRENGDWRQLRLWTRGQKAKAGCALTPKTCALLDDPEFEAATNNPHGHIKFSLLMPDTHVWPHCGPSNARLRMHLPLVVPDCQALLGSDQDAVACQAARPHIRVQDRDHVWKEGEVQTIDDSIEHEVWYPAPPKDVSSGSRLILIVDVKHPELEP